MKSQSNRNWPTSPDARRAVAAGAPAILAWGAFEQHGPHLPLSTDAVLAAALAVRVADAVGGFLLPPVAYGETSANAGFPGTVSLSFDTVRAMAVDIGTSLREGGFSRLVIVNGDFGNRAPLRVAAAALARSSQWPVLVIDYPGLSEAAAQICESPPAGPDFYHADEVETSLMLALAPDSVDMDAAVTEYPEFPETFGSTPIGLHEISRSGVFGDPSTASAAKGGALLAALEQRAVALARAFVVTPR